MPNWKNLVHSITQPIANAEAMTPWVKALTCEREWECEYECECERRGDGPLGEGALTNLLPPLYIGVERWCLFNEEGGVDLAGVSQ